MTAEKRECVSILVDAGLSIVKACLFVGISRLTISAFIACIVKWD